MLKALTEGAKLSPLGLLLNPTFWLAIGAWTAFVAFYVHDVSTEAERLKQTEITAKALQQQVDANDKVLKRERKLRADDRKEFADYKKEHEHAKENVAVFTGDLRSGKRQLRVPTSTVC